MYVFEPYKKSEDNFIANRKFTSCYNIEQVTGKNVCHFH